MEAVTLEKSHTHWAGVRERPRAAGPLGEEQAGEKERAGPPGRDGRFRCYRPSFSQRWPACEREAGRADGTKPAAEGVAVTNNSWSSN